MERPAYTKKIVDAAVAIMRSQYGSMEMLHPTLGILQNCIWGYPYVPPQRHLDLLDMQARQAEDLIEQA